METKYGGDDPQSRKTMRAMVAVDESDWSFYALSWALDHLFINTPSTVEAGEGQEGDLWKVTVAHVTEPFHHFLYPAGPGGGTYYATTSVVESVKKAQEETAAAILSRALQICKDKMVIKSLTSNEIKRCHMIFIKLSYHTYMTLCMQVKAETLILTGDPKDMICQATEQMHVDLLVVGSRGLGMVKR